MNVQSTPDSAQIFCWSHDEEFYHGDCASREEAAAAGFAHYPETDEIFVGVQVRSTAHRYVDGESILTQVSEQASDEAGEHAEDWLQGSEIRAPEKIVELEKMVGDWIQANDPPHFWLVEDVELVLRTSTGAA